MVQKIPTLSFRGETSPITGFAFGELRSYLTRTPQLHNLKTIQFGILQRDRDGYEFRVDKNMLQVLAANDISCLYAVYALLEGVGWRFPSPGEERFEASAFRASAWKNLTGKTEASFAYRSLTVLTASNEELRAVVEWMPKVRLNSIFIGHRENREQIEFIKPELAPRGIRLEVGGHVLDEFLPIEMFQSHAEYFRIKGGERRQDGNFCTSRFGTLQVVTENALKFVREYPEAQVFHFWAEDVEGGSWCECESCKGLTPSEQLMNTITAMADAIAQERPGVKIDFILYHDTLEFPETMHARPNVFALFAPRERCYAHGIGDASCAHNAAYASRFQAAKKVFGERLSVFEYYCDLILWRCLGITCPTTLLADLAWYKSKLVDDVQCLHFGQFSNWAYALNAFAFARASWDLNLTRDAIVTDFCHARYGEHARTMLQAYWSFEQASLHALTYDGYDKRAYDLRDPPGTPPEFVEKHIALVDQAIVQIETALTKMPAVVHRVIAAERMLLELTRDNLRALTHQMRGRLHEENQLDPNHAEKMKSEYDAAIALLNDLQRRFAELPEKVTGAWGREGAPNQFKLMAELLQSAREGKRQRDW